MIVGEAVAPSSPVEALPVSAVRGGVSTLASAIGGEAVLPSAAPRGGVAMRASSASASPTTCGLGDLVREGEDGAPCSPCSLITDLHGKTFCKVNNLQDTTSKAKLARLYLVASGSRVFGQNTQGLIVARILACIAAAVC
jgi:hypothetical protein